TGDVVLHGAHADDELGGDLAIAAAGGEEAQHLDLARCQAVGLLPLVADRRGGAGTGQGRGRGLPEVLAPRGHAERRDRLGRYVGREFLDGRVRGGKLPVGRGMASLGEIETTKSDVESPEGW